MFRNMDGSEIVFKTEAWTSLQLGTTAAWTTATPDARALSGYAPQLEKPLLCEACAPQGRGAPLTATRESPRVAMKTQHSQK